MCPKYFTIDGMLNYHMPHRQGSIRSMDNQYFLIFWTGKVKGVLVDATIQNKDKISRIHVLIEESSEIRIKLVGFNSTGSVW